MSVRIAFVYWQPQLTMFWGFVILLLVGTWVVLTYRRTFRRYQGPAGWLLMVPKVLIAFLLLTMLFDPVWAITQKLTEKLKFVVLVDTSSSMDAMNSEKMSRGQRAQRLSAMIAEGVDPAIEFDRATFDKRILSAAERGLHPSAPVRPTDLGRVLVELAQRHAKSKYDGVVLLTDGGDEQFRPARMPAAPLYIVGIGNDPADSNDILIEGLDAPASVEVDADFDVTVELRAYANAQFRQNLQRIEVELQYESDDGEWIKLASDQVDLAQQRSDAEFSIDGIDEPCRRRYRVLVDQLDEELTHLNNVREFSVDVQKKSLHVLLFSRALGLDAAILRRTLDRDPGVALTAMSRLTGERYVVQGDRQEGDEQLEAGFPNSVDVLQRYKCVIVGSFPANDWDERQMQALAEYVEQGGAVVFLGGEKSFGGGGYVETPLEPLLPWSLGLGEPELKVGKFAVTMTPTAEQDLISGWASTMQEAGSLDLDSINQPGPLKVGAASLLNCSAAGRQVAVLALQPYGQGRVLGVATNTMWRWQRAGGKRRDAYERFWTQGVRYLTGMTEGGRHLAVRFDREAYRPSEQADVDIQVIGQYATGQVRVEVSRTYDGQTEPLAVEQRGPSGQQFRCRTLFERRGEYLLTINAFAGGKMLESYQKTLHVGTVRNEGAQMWVNHSFLDTLASQGGGRYLREPEADQIAEILESNLTRRSVTRTVPLIEYKGIYLALFMIALVTEWVIRRRMNLF